MNPNYSYVDRSGSDPLSQNPGSPPPSYSVHFESCSGQYPTNSRYCQSSRSPRNHGYVPHEQTPLTSSNVPPAIVEGYGQAPRGSKEVSDTKPAFSGFCITIFMFLAGFFLRGIILPGVVSPVLADWCSQPISKDECRAQLIRLGVHWEEAQAVKCVSYNTLEYSAHLHNLPENINYKAACDSLPIEIHNQSLNEPYICYEEAGVIRGHWILDERELACRTFWDRFYDKGCVGVNSGLRRYDSRLWNVFRPDDWLTLCNATPAIVRGKYFDGPMYCEKRDNNFFVGNWEVEDSDCL
ncbi:hypothetical protein AcV5_000650 [Taiwanofungus camphoratus]|nr:hypothetical protein AcV5_000650 [Antrodia cinnamomea]